MYTFELLFLLHTWNSLLPLDGWMFSLFLILANIQGQAVWHMKKPELTDILQIGNSASENREYELKLTLGRKSWPNTVGERASQAISKLRDQGELDHLIIFLEAVPNIWKQIEFAARNFSTSCRIWASLKKKIYEEVGKHQIRSSLLITFLWTALVSQMSC